MTAAHRYLLIIAPPPAVAEPVMRFREALFARIGNFSGRRVEPHLTLGSLDVPHHLEGLLVERLEPATAGLAPATIHYDGIMHFPDKHTVYIDPVEKDTIARIRAPLMHAWRSESTLAEQLRETDHPHLTIAAGLTPQRFDQAWAMLAPHVFRAEQAVHTVVLLRRALEPGSLYERLAVFPFTG